MGGTEKGTLATCFECGTVFSNHVGRVISRMRVESSVDLDWEYNIISRMGVEPSGERE